MTFQNALTNLAKPGARPRWHADRWPAVVYAIGDIHGCLDQLVALHEKIVADAARFSGEKLIVCLGDYIDRGPKSAEVIAFLASEAPAGFTRICLAGNHEAMLLDFLDAPQPEAPWLQNGATTTLASYGVKMDLFDVDRLAQAMRRNVPGHHFKFLNDLALTLTIPGMCFVHAGLKRDVPISDQVEHDLLWIRKGAAEGQNAFGLVVVHGHTPAAEPVITPTRICVDTAVGTTGVLTAVRLIEGKTPVVLNAR